MKSTKVQTLGKQTERPSTITLAAHARRRGLNLQVNDSLGLVEEDGTPVHILSVVLVHGPGPGLGVEDAIVAVSCQLWLEERVELLRFNLLKMGGRRRRPPLQMCAFFTC